MAASMRLLVRRAIRLSHRNVTATAAGAAARSGCCRGPSVCRCFSDEADNRSTHFGFETVPEAEKAKRVYKVFENVAQKYDVMNDAMSLGIHRLWKDSLLHVMHPQPGAQLLDVAGGTGDIAFRFLEYVRSQEERQRRRAARSSQTPSWQDISNNYSTEDESRESRAVVCDINKEMLKMGKQKADSLGVSAGLNRQNLYDAYSFQMIPVLGEVIAGDWKSYQYLVESIRKFPSQEEFKDMIEDAGFYCVQYYNLTGGVVALHSGFKL
ncbi:2-methoxy-6-polyprenyl-1,4-benzoquinol methylase, mitochondrial [Stegastes partitus]|uniref:2-methoxy-6-polyprenyl-1,4-benzoquinol methylase, mitochondrial n=1 Tax=Stegastes partitus TaxID=144197 RepID=A0A9Y4N137_9TELE|nr:PREDICTED: 2-methoxy-6-polyprenyl-1,4-benzoquinol methylase, mitochondrial [Stegastes partitus]